MHIEKLEVIKHFRSLARIIRSMDSEADRETLYYCGIDLLTLYEQEEMVSERRAEMLAELLLNAYCFEKGVHVAWK